MATREERQSGKARTMTKAAVVTAKRELLEQAAIELLDVEWGWHQRSQVIRAALEYARAVRSAKVRE